MPRFKKKQQPEEDELRERKKRLDEYLRQLDLQFENEVKQLNTQTENLCKEVRTFFAVNQMKISKHIRETNLKDFFALRFENEETEVPIPKETAKKKNTHSSFKTKLVKQLSSKKSTKKEKRTLFTPKSDNNLRMSNVFTPKFDPRKPITPASGLRNVKPGERFIMMSVSGSPLFTDVNTVAGLVADPEGKTIHVTTDMPVPSDLDEDTMNKINMIKKELSKY